MSRLILSSLIPILSCATTFAQKTQPVPASGYTRSNGTNVAPRSRTNPGGNLHNNRSVGPNINPSTGQMGPHVIPPTSYRGPVIGSISSQAQTTIARPELQSTTTGKYNANEVTDALKLDANDDLRQQVVFLYSRYRELMTNPNDHAAEFQVTLGQLKACGRMMAADRIKALGVTEDVNWQGMELPGLLAIETRLKQTEPKDRNSTFALLRDSVYALGFPQQP